MKSHGQSPYLSLNTSTSDSDVEQTTGFECTRQFFGFLCARNFPYLNLEVWWCCNLTFTFKTLNVTKHL